MNLADIQDYTLNPNKPLLPKQQEGVRFLLTRRNAILAFQTGLGKTYTSCTALAHLQKLRDDIRGIIICPINALDAFEEALIDDLGYKEHEVGWLTNQRLEYDENLNKVFIISYPALDKYYILIEELNKRYILVAIIDEAHKLQADEKNSKQKALLSNLKRYFAVNWLLTATPLINSIEGLYNIITFLEPNFFGGKTAFWNRYIKYRLKDIWVKGGTKRKVREIIGYKNLDELNKRIQKICMMRQRKYNLKFAYISEKLTEEELSIYEKVSAGIINDDRRNFSARMHDLQRVVDNCYENEMISEYDSTKEKLLLKTLNKVMEKGYPIIIYCDYKDTVRRLEYVLKENKNNLNYNKIYKITGSVSKEERRYIKDNITSRDIIIITSAGSESINLQKSNCVLFYDIPYSIGTILQTIGRITRVDTKHKYQYIIVLYTKGTIDEYKYLLFLDHAKLIKDILGSDANLPVNNLREIDKKNLDKLRTQLLWHYKDDRKKLMKRKRKLIRNNLITVSTEDMIGEIGDYFINLNPITDVKNTKRIKYLTPSVELFNKLKSNKEFYTIFKNKYIDQLKSDNTQKVLTQMINSIVNNNKRIILVDDYNIGKIIKDFILENME